MNHAICLYEYDQAKKELGKAAKGISFLSKSMAMTLLNKARQRLSGKPPAEVFEAHFETTVCGIPCGIRVSYYVPEQMIRGCMSTQIDPPDPEEIEFMVLDRSGYVADWLANKMTMKDIDRIEDLIRRGAR